MRRETSARPDALRPTHGDYPDLFQQLLRDRDLTFRTWSVVDGEFPEGPHDAEGWLITGSRHGAYEDMLLRDWQRCSTLGIDVVVNPRSITVSTILQSVRRGRIRAVHSLGDGFGALAQVAPDAQLAAFRDLLDLFQAAGLEVLEVFQHVPQQLFLELRDQHAGEQRDEADQSADGREPDPGESVVRPLMQAGVQARAGRRRSTNHGAAITPELDVQARRHVALHGAARIAGWCARGVHAAVS